MKDLIKLYEKVTGRKAILEFVQDEELVMNEPTTRQMGAQKMMKTRDME